MTTCAETTRLTMFPGDRDQPPIACRREVGPDGTHRGQHQGIHHIPERPGDPDGTFDFQRKTYPATDRLVTWGEGGGSSSVLCPDEQLADNCTTCQRAAKGLSPYGTPHDPSDHRWETCVHCGVTFHNLGHYRGRHHPDTRDGWCFNCAEWMTRASTYAEPGTNLVRPHDDALAHGQARLYGWNDVTGAFGGAQFIVTWDDGRTVGPRDSLWDAGAIPAEWLTYFPPNAVVQRGEQVARAGHTDRLGRPLTYTGHP